MGADFNGKAYEAIYKHPEWAKTADEYEVKFAAKLYKAPYVQEAAKTALTKLSRMLNAYYKQRGQNGAEEMTETAGAITQVASELTGDRVEITDILEEALLPEGESSTGAGQIGRAARNLNADSSEAERREAHEKDRRNLNEVINGDGNLRERMTMLYNGMFINGGRGAQQIRESRSLKNMMANMTEEEAASNRELSGVRFDLLSDMPQRKKHGDVFSTYSIARDLKKNSDKIERKGNAVSRFFAGISRAWNAAVSSKFTRKTKRKEDRKGLGEQHYRELGLELSDRERANGMVGEGASLHLNWQEGSAVYEMKERTNAEGMLQTAGPSGTTLRMLAAYKLMGASLKDLLQFRLALIAWMVTSKDHSLFEIMKGSHNAGVEGGEDLTEPATMYMTVDPIPVDVLRAEYAPEKQFPHETVYKLMLNELQQKRESQAKFRNEKRVKKSPKIRNQVEDLTYLQKHIKELDAMIEKIKEKRERKTREYQNNGRMAEAQRYFVSMSTTLRAFTDQKKYLTEEIENRKEELKLGGYEMTEDDQYTLYSKNTSGVLQNVGKDAMNAKAQDLALNIYSTGAYLSMTRGQKYGNLIGKSALSDKRVNASRSGGVGSYEFSSSAEMKEKNLGDFIFNLVRISSRMSQDALEERGLLEQEDPRVKSNGTRAYSKRTFRGARLTKEFHTKEGETITTGSLQSSSKDFIQALSFYQTSLKKRGDKDSVLVEYQMTGKGSVDISARSKFEYEHEVLIPAATRFKVVTGLRRVRYDSRKIYWEEGERQTEAEEAIEKAASAAVGKKAKKNTEEDMYRLPAYGYAIRLEEVSGPGERKRNETGTAADMRRQIRASYLANLQQRRSAQ